MSEKKRCRSRSKYGNCGRLQHKDHVHAIPVGGGADPISDRALWFVYGRGVTPGYRVTMLMSPWAHGEDER